MKIIKTLTVQDTTYALEPTDILYYSTLSAAVADLEAGTADGAVYDTAQAHVKVCPKSRRVTLLDDLTEEEPIAIDGELTLELDGHRLSATLANSGVAHIRGGTVTAIENSGDLQLSGVTVQQVQSAFDPDKEVYFNDSSITRLTLDGSACMDGCTVQHLTAGQGEQIDVFISRSHVAEPVVLGAQTILHLGTACSFTAEHTTAPGQVRVTQSCCRRALYSAPVTGAEHEPVARAVAELQDIQRWADIGSLEELKTKDQSSIVSAINELAEHHGVEDWYYTGIPPIQVSYAAGQGKPLMIECDFEDGGNATFHCFQNVGTKVVGETVLDGKRYCLEGDVLTGQWERRIYEIGEAIIETASGRQLVLPDSADRPIRGLTVFGTPGASADSLTITAAGKNLVDIHAIQPFTYYKKTSGTAITRNGVVFDTPAAYTISAGNPAAVNSETWVYGLVLDSNDISTGNSYNAVTEYGVVPQTVTVAPGQKLFVYDATSHHNTEAAKGIFAQMAIQVELGNTATAYVPFRSPMEAVITTGMPLQAEPVDSGGNVTIDGQQYLADTLEIGDYQNVVVVKRCGRDTPAEFHLEANEESAVLALKTCKPVTSIYNSAGAYQTVQYVADTKAYIDKKFAEVTAAVLSQGANV